MRYARLSLYCLLLFLRTGITCAQISIDSDFDLSGDAGVGGSIDVPGIDDPGPIDGSPSYNSQNHHKRLKEEQKMRLEQQKLRQKQALQLAMTENEQMQLVHQNKVKVEIKTKDIKAYDSVLNIRLGEHEKDLSQMEKLALSIKKIKVPQPQFKHYNTVLFLGTGNDRTSAEKLKKEGFASAFSLKPYDEIFAFGIPGADFNADLLGRSLPDALLSDWDKLSPETQKYLVQLKNVTIETLEVHSNGATVAGVIIKHDIIKVKELKIIGGDRAVLNLEYWNKLAEEKGIKITIYAIENDIVPFSIPGWKIYRKVKDLGPGVIFHTFEGVKNLTYQVMGLQKSTYNDNDKVKVHTLTPPQEWKSAEDHHMLVHYQELIIKWKHHFAQPK